MLRPFWNRQPIVRPALPLARPSLSSATINRRLGVPGSTTLQTDPTIVPIVDLASAGWGEWQSVTASVNLSNGSLGGYAVAAPVTDAVPAGFEREFGWFGFRIALTSLAADQRLVVVPVLLGLGIGFFVNSETLSLTPVGASSNRGGCGLPPMILQAGESPTVYVRDIEDGVSNVIQCILAARYRDRRL